MSAWSLLTLDDEHRQFAGNTGYNDDLSRQYSYDSTVPNHKQVKPGHLVVLRDNVYVLGVARVSRIDAAPDSKSRLRCPTCGNTGLKERRSGLRYRCDRRGCLAEFDIPQQDTVHVTTYVAHYGDSWSPLTVPVRVAVLLALYTTHGKQHSIRPLDPGSLETLLQDWGWSSERPEGPTSEIISIIGGHTLRLARQRRGQRNFRLALLERFGCQCAITGPQPPQILEAAHLYAYATGPVHEVNGGLLLRRDLHTLFDAGLIVIDPETWQIRVSPGLGAYPHLQVLDGQPLNVPEAKRPLAKWLVAHRAAAHASGAWRLEE